MLEQPGDLCRREIGVRDETSDGLVLSCHRSPGDAIDLWRRLPALPNNRRRDRHACSRIPKYRCLALISDADCSDLLWSNAGLGDNFVATVDGRAPDFARILIHPSRLGIKLSRRPLREAERSRLSIIKNRAARRRSLINCEKIFW